MDFFDLDFFVVPKKLTRYLSGTQRNELPSMDFEPMNSTPKVRLKTVETVISVMRRPQRKRRTLLSDPSRLENLFFVIFVFSAIFDSCPV